MNSTLRILVLATVMATPLVAFAADKADDKTNTETTSAPPKDVATYPCWDMMQDGHMQHMHGMMSGKMQMPPQGVKAHTCWDMMQDGRMMRMHNMHMMWKDDSGKPAQKP